MNGMVNTAQYLNLEDEAARGVAERALSMTEELKKRIAPPGGLGPLPPLLEQRRQTEPITDGAFRCQCAYDRILVHQISQTDGEHFDGSTRIVMPDVSKDREKRDAPRGIIVSAGLQALDVLRSNGMDLGHIVTFIRLAPWRLRVETILGKEKYLLVMRVGDIIGSEDLRTALRNETMRIGLSPDGQHVVHDVVTDVLADTIPSVKMTAPWAGDDY